ncbi:hypothetical protein QR680_009799 [Steinernema hermaphroditum]|uniref:Lon proteolytic domain-containing protein n=1 Tax=Steinernema hermaphroditum TaxID=289476 RepID=A0AA39MAK1_9BILA|nr:hypothetical protein QR680_009799 [Steinernema hermaphroditum]
MNSNSSNSAIKEGLVTTGHAVKYETQEMIAEELRKGTNVKKADEILVLPWGVNHSKQTVSKRDTNFRWLTKYLLHLERATLLEQELMKTNRALKPTNLYLVAPRGIPLREMAMEVAELMGRPFQEIRLGKESKAADLLGSPEHMGLVMRAVKEARCCDPVIFIEDLVEVNDKKLLKVVGQLGDHSKSRSFIDRYCGVPFDLSNTLFIVAEGRFERKPATKRHFLHFNEHTTLTFGMTSVQKINVVKKTVIPKLLEEHKALRAHFFRSRVLRMIIEDFTKENGVEHLTETLKLVAEKGVEENNKEKKLTKAYLEEILGKPRIWVDATNYIDVTECHRMRVGGSRVLGVDIQLDTCDGHFNGMYSEFSEEDTIQKETPTLRTTVAICLSLLHRNAERYGIRQSLERKVNVVHAIGDGASIGFSTFLSLYSLFSGKRLRADSACSGEVKVDGRIGLIGGVYLKSLAAYKNGIRKIVFPEENRDCVKKKTAGFMEEMEFVFVNTLDELISEMVE